METNELIEDVKATQRLSSDWKDKINKFIDGVFDITLIFMGKSKRANVGGYEIIIKHPWFLSKKKFGNEIVIKTMKRNIISWLDMTPGYSFRNRKYRVDFSYDDIENLKDYLIQLRSLLDIDLLETKFDQLEKEALK